MALTVYTLKTCDTCKKAQKWLEAKGIAYQNHDVRADRLDRKTVKSIVDALGWETTLNRRSTTWRGLEDAQKIDLDDAKAIALIVDNPTLLKRPVFDFDGSMIAGFDTKSQAAVEAAL